MYSCFCFSQNIISNYSFEDTLECPGGVDELYNAPPWFRPTIGTGVGSSDYFNSCTSNSSASTPDNIFGYQTPKTGAAYAGLGVYVTDFGGEGREYIEAPLKNLLISNKKYCVEFYVSLAEKTNLPSGGIGGINTIGAYFSQDSVLSNSWVHIPVIPQVESNFFILDTTNWVLISGEFIAQGGEKFITIGNFRDDANTNVMSIDTVPCGNGFSCEIYYFIDDVSVFCCDNANTQIELGNNISICYGDSINIGQPLVAGYYYRWSSANGLNSNDTSIAQPIVKPIITTTYYLFVEDTVKKQSCNNTATDSITIFVTAPATANAGNDTTICEGENVVLGSPEINGYEYYWQPLSGLNDSTIAQPIASPMQTTKYLLIVQDSGNYCPPVQDSVTISDQNCDTLEPPKENSIFLPSIFSPNGDGNNDIFRVRGNNISEINLTIYNRWGEIVFETKDKSLGWDGAFNGSPLNPGVFVFYLNVIYEDGNSEELKGNITLVR